MTFSFPEIYKTKHTNIQTKRRINEFVWKVFYKTEWRVVYSKLKIENKALSAIIINFSYNLILIWINRFVSNWRNTERDCFYRASDGSKNPMSVGEHFIAWKYQNVYSGFLLINCCNLRHFNSFCLCCWLISCLPWPD